MGLENWAIFMDVICVLSFVTHMQIPFKRFGAASFHDGLIHSTVAAEVSVNMALRGKRYNIIIIIF